MMKIIYCRKCQGSREKRLIVGTAEEMRRSACQGNEQEVTVVSRRKADLEDFEVIGLIEFLLTSTF